MDFGMQPALASILIKMRFIKSSRTPAASRNRRGAESTISPLIPYWKGDKINNPGYVAEVNAFNGAQTLAERDAYPAAAAAFEKFLKGYPASTLKPNAEFGLALAVSGTDRAKGLAQLKAFAEKNRAHPFAADAQRAISQLEKAH